VRWHCIYWIGLAEDRDQCRALVNTVMNHEMLVISSVAAELAAYLEGLSSVELVTGLSTSPFDPPRTPVSA
jgi:hypothetical protein